MHRGGASSLRDIDWVERRWDASQAYSDSKLYVTALAFAVARRWPDVLSNAVDPGWVPTKMGGPGAPDDLEKGYLTQTWLAVSDEAAATVSGALLAPSQTGGPGQGSVQPPLSRSAFGQARGIDGRVSLLIQTRSFSSSAWTDAAA